MHYTGTIWRPPYEAGSLLLEVTAGCTHHQCKFCTLYDDIPFRFRMTPLEDIEADLLEAQTYYRSSFGRKRPVRRVFLVGANPFVLQFARLKTIAERIHHFFPECESIGCFARITDVAAKTDDELRQLRALGYDGITIGVETGDDAALAFMRKGYTSVDILTQTRRLDAAGLSYCYLCLVGLAGKGRGVASAKASAALLSRTHPRLLGTSMLTLYPNSDLYREMQAGNWTEEPELEKLEELRTFVQHLTLSAFFCTPGASNAFYIEGRLPADRAALLARLDSILSQTNERDLRHYRTHLKHL